ncbi:hypothetical protein BH11BAC5_BH11BAC5_08120 [soil metagenome]
MSVPQIQKEGSSVLEKFSEAKRLQVAEVTFDVVRNMAS